MTFTRFSLMVSALLALAWATVGAGPTGPQIVRQGGTDNLDGVADLTHGVMKWSHGAFLYKDTGTTPPSFYTLGRDGQLIATATQSIPGAGRYVTTGYDRRRDGSIVSAGQAYFPVGQSVPFLTWLSGDGRTARIVRTAPYYPYLLSIAPDGTVWTIGLEMINGDTEAQGVNREAGVLRHFDSSGKLINSAFPQSQFHPRLGQDRLLSGFLVAAQDRLGWYAPREGAGKYVEVSTGTMEVREYPGPPQGLSNGGPAVGFALTDSGVASVSIQDKSPGLRTAYYLDRAASKWVPITVPSLGGYRFAPHLMGSDGETLVFQYAHSAAFFKLSAQE